MPQLDLLVIGDINPDLVISGEDLHPDFGQAEIIAEHASLVVGGSASITAVGAARLGLRTGACGVVGDDSLGKFMFDQLEAAGVATDHLRVEELRPTGISAVLVERDDRAIITAPGTISDLAPEDLDMLGDVPAAHVHVSSYYLMSPAFRTALPAHLRRFRTNGCTTSIDTNWDPSGEWLLDDALAAVDLFLPNKTELLEIAGRSSIGDALDVLTRGGCTVVVKAGEDGAFTRSDGLMIRAPIPAITGFVDAIGAGDSFNAGFIAARHHGLGVADALKVAVAVGSLSTRAAGGTGGQPDWGEALLWAGLEP